MRVQAPEVALVIFDPDSAKISENFGGRKQISLYP